MKKPINLGQVLAFGSFFSIVVVLFGINLMKNKLGGRTYSTVPVGNSLLDLQNKTISKSEGLQTFTSLSMDVQFIDSLIFIPSTNPRIDISGDKALVDAFSFYRGNSLKHLFLASKFQFYVNESDHDSIKSEPYFLKKGGLKIKIYYQKLYHISINQAVKTIVHKGVFEADKVNISAPAVVAKLNVKTKHLQLNLEKASTFPIAKWMAEKKHQYNDQLIQYTNQPLRVVGKADLVETINNGHSILDLAQLQCRHMHADYANAKYSVLEVAPTQLFSYIIRRDNVDHHSEMICKSKAVVTKAYYLPELELVERFH